VHLILCIKTLFLTPNVFALPLLLLKDNVLNYDKVEHGTVELELGELDIISVLHKSLSAFKLQAQRRKLNLSLESPDNGGVDEDPENWAMPRQDHLIVIGDEQRLQQVIHNLLSNAFKFTSQNGMITIRATFSLTKLNERAQMREDCSIAAARLSSIGAETGLSCCGSVEVRVEDEGVGMTENQIAGLFQEGVQFNASKLQDGGGSGLGLFISKELIELHGGEITAESNGIGRGSTFLVKLPVYKSTSSRLSRETKDPTGKDEEAVEGERYHTSSSENFTLINEEPPSRLATGERMTVQVGHSQEPHRILVVDDVATTLKLLIRVLERNGHVCQGAPDGKEAIEVFENADAEGRPFDTILMDSEMEFMNGPTATRALRKKGYTDTLIVGVTGNVLPEDVEFFKSMGADEVLGKPLKLSDLKGIWDKRSEDTASTSA